MKTVMMITSLLFCMLARAQTSPVSLTETGDSAVVNDKVYLIITNSTFADACYRFADWKRTKGYWTYVLAGSDSYVWTDANVLSAISSFTESQGHVDYLLFVGNSQVPGHEFVYQTEKGYTATARSDYYYECLGDPVHNTPAIRVGRIPVIDADEADDVFDKIIAYEQSPTNNDAFYHTGVSVAVFDINNPYGNLGNYEYRRSVLSSENICSYLENTITHPKEIKRIYLHTSQLTDSLYKYNYGRYNGTYQFLPSELQNADRWSGDSFAINDSINAGALFLAYNGGGDSLKWVNMVYGPVNLYDYSHVHYLTNQNKYPVIFSMSDDTGIYHEASDCPAEFFLKQEDAGAVAVFAPTGKTFMGFDEYMTEGFINAVWPQPGINSIHPLGSPVYELGDILAAGREWMGYMHTFNPTTHQQDSLYKDYTDKYSAQLNLYHCFGDPSMMMYTEKPSCFTNVSVRKNGTRLIVDTGEADTKVTFHTPMWETMFYVDSYLGSHVEYQNEMEGDSMYICIDKHNFVPYIQKWHYRLNIQNETITGTHTYIAEEVNIGRHVTNDKPQGDVLIQGANIEIQGGNVTLYPGTTIVNSNVTINRRE